METEDFLGAVLEPGNDDYETARQIWNGVKDDPLKARGPSGSRPLTTSP